MVDIISSVIKDNGTVTVREEKIYDKTEYNSNLQKELEKLKSELDLLKQNSDHYNNLYQSSLNRITEIETELKLK